MSASLFSRHSRGTNIKSEAKIKLIRRVIPGFSLSLGLTILLLSLVVLLPLLVTVVKGLSFNLNYWLAILSTKQVRSALILSFGGAISAAAFATIMGLAMAWILVRHQFIGKRLIEGLVDVPFALPTSVAGIALASLYGAHGWFGKALLHFHISLIYTPYAVILAMIFVGMPFAIRSIEPVLKDLSPDYEQSAALCGATKTQIFRLIILPTLLPSLLSGFSLAFARSLAEYGSIIFISGNLPGYTEIAPLLIIAHLESYDLGGALIIALSMMALSFTLLLLINLWLKQRQKRMGL